MEASYNYSRTEHPNPIKYLENKGSAQCKSCVMLAALNTPGKTMIKAKNQETILSYSISILNYQ